MRKGKLTTKLVALFLILSLAMPMGAFATTTELQADATAPGISLAGMYPAYDDIEFQWSITEDATHKVVFEGVTTTEGLTFSLDKNTDRGYVDPEMYPYNATTTIGDIEKYVDKEKNNCFKIVDKKVVDGNLEVTIETHGTEYYYIEDAEADAAGVAKNYSIDHTNGANWLDKCGYYDFNVSADGKVVGTVPAKVVPYDSYRTGYELHDQIAALGDAETDRYVETGSIGNSTVSGYDTPYVIVADKESDVKAWLEYVEAVKEDPTKVKADIEAGKYADLAVPVYVSNCHANENPAVNGPMVFAEYLIYGDSQTFTTNQDEQYPFSTNDGKVSLDTLDAYTDKGFAKLEQEKEEVFGTGISEYIADWLGDKGKGEGELGRLRGEYGDTKSGNYGWSAPMTGEGNTFEDYYVMGEDNFTVDELLDDVFYVFVPTMNTEGYLRGTRATAVGFDPNRDYANQVMNEDRAAMAFMSQWVPMVYMELHGRVEGYSVEPCGAPHNPNIEYDLIGEQFFQLGYATGKAMVANNPRYNSYELCGRDYIELDKDSPTGVQWGQPWDDLSTNFGSQFPVFFGTSGVTWEQPAYDDICSEYSIPAGLYGVGRYVQESQAKLLTNQALLFERGVNNTNSDELVAPYYVDQYDQMGKQADIMRPAYDGEGQNGQFYPEAYIIPLDKENQRNIQDAAETVLWIVRNNCEYMIADKAFEYDGVTYPEGTVVVSMYQPFRSIVNGQLCDGQFVNVWGGLYSEAFSQFRIARGYDQITVAEPAAYETIAAACKEGADYEGTLANFADFAAQFSGVKNADVIISNASEDAAGAVNALLKAGKTVGMVTEGEYMGDYICYYGDFVEVVADEYVVSAEGVYGTDIEAAVIELPTVYVSNKYTIAKSGFTGFAGWDYKYNFNTYAMKQMGFETTTEAAEADVVFGNGFNSSDADKAAKQAVLGGTPYMVAGSSANLRGIVDGVSVAYMSTGTDMTAVVEYPETTLVNASYVADGDYLNYQYGTAYFAAVPDGAKVIVKNAGKDPVTGCVFLHDSTDPEKSAKLEAEFDIYNNAPVAFEYQANGMDVVSFANSLTHKGHPTDEFKYIANFIFSRSLSDADFAGTTEREALLEGSIAELEKELEESKNLSAAEKAELEATIAELQAKLDALSEEQKLAAPEAKAANVAKTGKIVVSWKAVDGADEYKVYRATSKEGTYKLMKTTSNTKYTNTSATAGKKYYYKVKAVTESKKVENSAFSKVVSRTCDYARPAVTAKAGKKQVKLTWKKVDGAKKYVVYRATSAKGTYKKVATTTKLSYTNKNLKAKKTYYYKVKAIGAKNAASAYSLVDKCKTKA